MAEKYKVVVAVKGYYTSADAKNRKSPRTTVRIGTYYVYNKYNGMVNVTSKSGTPGSWINPADNKKKVSNPKSNSNSKKKSSSKKKKKKSSSKTGKSNKSKTTTQKLYRVNAFGDKVLRGYIVRDDTGAVIPFQFNPDSWTRTFKGVYVTPDAPGSVYPEINYIRQDKRTIPLSISYDKRVDSQHCKKPDDIISKLEKLTQPSSAYTVMQRGSKKFVAPPTCRFVFGDLVIKCKVSECKVTRKAYDKNLLTTAFMADLELLEVV